MTNTSNRRVEACRLVSAMLAIGLMGTASPQAVRAQEPEAPDDAKEDPGAESDAPEKPEDAAKKSTDTQDTHPPGTLPISPVELGSARWVPGDGLTFESEDGDFALRTRLRAQLRYKWRHDVLQDDGSRNDSQVFHFRRARVQFEGHMWGEHNEFKLELAISPRDMDLRSDSDGTQNVATQTPLLSWYFNFSHLRDLTVRIGQYKVPYSRQRVVSSGNQQFVERAITNSEFELDRDIGLDIRSENFLGLDMFRYYAGIYIGEGMNTSDNTIGAGDFGMMYLARVEFLPFGMFNDYSEADFARTKDFRLSFGGAYAYIDEAPGLRGIEGPRPAGEVDTHNVTADVMIKYAGFSVFSDFYFREVKANNPADPERDGIGAMVQAGYLLGALPLEFAVRYGGVRGVTDNTALDDPGEIDNSLGGAISYYVAQHPFKIQADYFREWADAAGLDQGEDRVRVQLQVAF